MINSDSYTCFFGRASGLSGLFGSTFMTAAVSAFSDLSKIIDFMIISMMLRLLE